MATGTVKIYLPEKGYGFIAQDNGGKDLFFDSTNVDAKYITEGLRVEYETIVTRKGPAAAKIKIIS